MNTMPTDEFRTAYHDHVRTDVVPFAPTTGGKLLDFGGGIGATAAYLRAAGNVETVGVADLVDNTSSPTGLDFSYQANLEEDGLIERIVAEQGKFQMILALDILEHLLDPWATARQLADALDDGGYLVVSLPNIRNYKALVPLLLRNRWDYQDAGILDRTHLRFFVKSTACDLVRQTGLSVQKVEPSPSSGRKVALFRTLTLGLLNSFTDRQYVIVAQKLS